MFSKLASVVGLLLGGREEKSIFPTLKINAFSQSKQQNFFLALSLGRDRLKPPVLQILA